LEASRKLLTNPSKSLQFSFRLKDKSDQLKAKDLWRESEIGSHMVVKKAVTFEFKKLELSLEN